MAMTLAYCVASLLALAWLGQVMGEFYELRKGKGE